MTHAFVVEEGPATDPQRPTLRRTVASADAVHVKINPRWTSWSNSQLLSHTFQFCAALALLACSATDDPPTPTPPDDPTTGHSFDKQGGEVGAAVRNGCDSVVSELVAVPVEGKASAHVPHPTARHTVTTTPHGRRSTRVTHSARNDVSFEQHDATACSPASVISLPVLCT